MNASLDAEKRFADGTRLLHWHFTIHLFYLIGMTNDWNIDEWWILNRLSTEGEWGYPLVQSIGKTNLNVGWIQNLWVYLGMGLLLSHAAVYYVYIPFKSL